LLFGLFVDELEQWLHNQLPGAGVPLGPRPLLMRLLYADDLVLLASSPQQHQQQLDHLHQFCMEKGVGVDIAKIGVVVFRHLKSFVSVFGDRVSHHVSRCLTRLLC
jgi:hypothetical protein